MEVFVWLYVSIFFGHRTFWSRHRLPGNLTVRQDFRALLHVAEVHNLPFKNHNLPFLHFGWSVQIKPARYEVSNQELQSDFTGCRVAHCLSHNISNTGSSNCVHRWTLDGERWR